MQTRRRFKQTTLTLWQQATVDGAVLNALTKAIENQIGNQIYRDDLNALAQLLGKARKIVIVQDAD